MYIPPSTYRIQFNNQFTFQNLEENLDYLTSLGIGAIYASPVFGAVPGSNHGYDVTDPHNFNPEIGTLQQFGQLISRLKSMQTGWIQDIVPNHMAFHPNNSWLTDVLEKGRQSAYAGYFDIEWDHPVFKDKVLVPVLGKTPDEAVENNEIKLHWENGGFFICYYDFRLPLSGESFHELLEEYKDLEESQYVGQGIASTEFKTDPAFSGFGWSNSRERFQAIYNTDSSFENLVDHICENTNSNPSKLKELLSKQHYVLAHWQVTDQVLNYRRFFTINGLISLCMENPKVFEDYHSFIQKQVNEGRFQGLRIDHVDGLLCPGIYFERLRASMGEETYIVAEKILERHEQLNKKWPLQGSSGYDFLAIVNNVFTNQEGCRLLNAFYKDFANIKLDPEDIIYLKKKLILTHSFRGDWDNICRKAEETGLITFNESITRENLHEAIGEFLVNFPVYKLYSYELPLDEEDATIIKRITDRSISRTPHLAAPLNKLRHIFLGDKTISDKERKNALDIFLRCMQYTGPLMAKGIEDTAMYWWAGFIAHNEVGDSIEADGITIPEFHQRMKERHIHYPHTINATATHDTKRGEDTRSRLNVISEFSKEWMQLVRKWSVMNQSMKSLINGNPAPDSNEEYFIYQTLAGAMPMNGNPDPTLSERLSEYIQKALREAKVNSDWNKPNEPYEKAVKDFVLKLLDENSSFMQTFQPFLKKIIPWGITNSLSQVVLKCTCPGIPDFYQGTELWDLSLVDPDNRRSVDYNLRASLLEEIQSPFVNETALFNALCESGTDGKIKLWITHKLMLERKKAAHVFNYGEYIPLKISGEYKAHLLAFARRHEKLWYITVVPIQSALLPQNEDMLPDWKDTAITIPAPSPGHWRLLWNNSLLKGGKEIKVAEVLKKNCPAVLKAENTTDIRGSGILLHLTSLPGKYGSGDLGQEAYRFADFLKKSKQMYWQILPFNPVDRSFSPYSSSSAFAGNIMLIDPDDLHKNKLINKLPDLMPEATTAAFSEALSLKEKIVDEAFSNYTKRNNPLLQKNFEQFCTNEGYWLRDFALFCVFKQKFAEAPWNEWPAEIKKREKPILLQLEEKYAIELTRIKFGQYLFSSHFKKLKFYVNSLGIKIIGDIPIYVSYDSADVWANPHLFNLDENLLMKTVAGVPPDYFSKTGQLWNMPVYNWERMKTDNFSWWKQRTSRNLEFCDMLRFDHFRGFSSYWEVPAGETTAVNGQWTKGPGEYLFTELKKTFPQMPFIAEDLGDIDEDVYQLRDTFNLMGMKVLQFAFGDDMPQSVHIPHNHRPNSVVYTGTHDNNTIRGWFKKEADKKIKARIGEYFNHKPNANTIAGEFVRMAFSSVANIVIVPMQDVMNLGESARFNTPSKPVGNWQWKLTTLTSPENYSEKLKQLTDTYGRTTT